MSKPDRFDKEAAEMLPCRYLTCDHVEFRDHVSVCPANYRQDVAARLRKDGAEVSRAYDLVSVKAAETADARLEILELQAELAQLRAQLTTLHGKIINLPASDVVARVLGDSYRLGHRDARHAAAELCVTLLYDAKEAIRAATSEGER